MCASKFISETQTYMLPFDLLVPPERRGEILEKVLLIHEAIREIRPLEIPKAEAPRIKHRRR